MKKINGKSRIIIEKEPGVLRFYYQDACTSSRRYLFTQKFSGSVFMFFRNGKTIGEIYRFHKWKNDRLSKTISRIPAAVEAAIKEATYYPVYKEAMTYEH